MPSTWLGLYAEMDRLDLSKRRLLAAQGEFESWARSAEQRAIAEAQAAATLRARELWERTAVGVVVEAPQRSEPDRPGPRWLRVSLRLGASRADLYSVRSAGSSPCLHLGVQRAATSTRFPVFTTVPGALLVRRSDDGFDALSLPLPADSADRPRTTIDGLVLRAFELLCGAHRSAQGSTT
jgi:hypothetical protein